MQKAAKKFKTEDPVVQAKQLPITYERKHLDDIPADVSGWNNMVQFEINDAGVSSALGVYVCLIGYLDRFSLWCAIHCKTNTFVISRMATFLRSQIYFIRSHDKPKEGTVKSQLPQLEIPIGMETDPTSLTKLIFEWVTKCSQFYQDEAMNTTGGINPQHDYCFTLLKKSMFPKKAIPEETE